MPGVMDNLQEEVLASLIRLPLAALLGAALALRPRRSGTPEREPAVVQTQIILAVVGSLIMLVVGASLARAFGIVGAANLIRYRSKIEDPKDAVVMLCALSVGLASGVGLYGLAVIGTVFIAACLWVIEGFEPQTRYLRVERQVRRQDPGPAAEDRRSAAALQGRSTSCARRPRMRCPTWPPRRGAAHRSRFEPAHGAGAVRQGRHRMDREVQGQGTEVAVKLIIQPEAGVVPIVKAIKTRQEVDRRLHLSLRPRRCREGAGGGGAAWRRRASDHRAHQSRRRSAAAQARAAAAGGRHAGVAQRGRPLALPRQVHDRRLDAAPAWLQLHEARHGQEPQLRRLDKGQASRCRKP